MTITARDQIGMIREILYNHKTDCCGQVSEYQQIQRLIQSLVAKGSLNEQEKQTMYDIYQYTQTGVNGRNIDNHITNHDESLGKWIHELDASYIQ